MGSKSKIEWTDATWNPIMGCTRVNDGCAHCYALAMIKRYAGQTGWPTSHREVEYFPERLEYPSLWRRARNIFVCSMSDLFHDLVMEGWIHNIYNEMEDCPRHTFFVLTKRHERMVEFTTRKYGEVPSNILNGVSVSTERDLCRIDALHKLNGRRFISFEPLIGNVVLCPDLHGIEWVVIGGESGIGARPIDVDVARSLVERAQGSGCRVFFKQFGSIWAKDHGAKSRKGSDPGEWPEWAKIREHPKQVD